MSTSNVPGSQEESGFGKFSATPFGRGVQYMLRATLYIADWPVLMFTWTRIIVSVRKSDRPGAWSTPTSRRFSMPSFAQSAEFWLVSIWGSSGAGKEARAPAEVDADGDSDETPGDELSVSVGTSTLLSFWASGAWLSVDETSPSIQQGIGLLRQPAAPCRLKSSTAKATWTKSGPETRIATATMDIQTGRMGRGAPGAYVLPTETGSVA
jgi:hypothetical protein